MMSPQQAFVLFSYADWAMLLMGCAAMLVSIGWGIYAILSVNKGRRRRPLLRALIGFLVFAMVYVTQLSVLIPFFNNWQWTPASIVLFALPIVAMVVGLIASIACGIHAILRRTGKQRRQIIRRSLLGVVVFGVCLSPHTATMLIPILSAEDHANRPGTLTHVGEPAPDFDLTSIDGTKFRTGELRGQVVVLNFFATWCGPCQMELPHLQTIWNEFQNNGDFRMLVIGREEPNDNLKAFKRKYAFTFPIASDPNKSVYSKFATQSIPRTYLLSREGTIVYQCTGYYKEEIAKLKKLLSKELARKK